MDWRDQTLEYYEENGKAFVEGTLTADMKDARDRFLEKLPMHPYVLDFACGSGRDTKAFLQAGCRVDAVDGSETMCQKASEYTGISVKKMLFTDLDADNTYDGIWACASILHLPKNELKTVLAKIKTALKQGGVLYTSFKYGDFEGMRNGRYFTYMTEKELEGLLHELPELQVIETWITADVRPGRKEEQWINILARRV